MPVIALLATSSAAAVAVVGAATCKLKARRVVKDEEPERQVEEIKEQVDRIEQDAVKPMPGVLGAHSSLDIEDVGSITTDSTTDDGASPTITITPPESPGNSARPLFMCPWHEGVSHFLESTDLGRLSCSCTAARMILTVEGPVRRLLLVPILDLQMHTAEAELRRVSLPHVHALRVKHRLAFNELAMALKRCPQGLCNLERLACNGCSMHPPDVRGLLSPALAATQGVRLLSMEKNKLNDAMIENLCNSGALEKVEQLNLRFNLIGDKGAKALAACPAVKKMKWVNLKMNFVGDEGALALSEMLKDPECSMTMLNLRRQSPGLTNRSAVGFADMLRNNSTLERLRLRHNKIEDNGAVSLAHATGEHVAKLSAQAAYTGESVRFELDLEHNKVRDKGAIALLRTAVGVPASKAVELELLLHGNPATRDSLRQALMEAGDEGLDASDTRLWFETKAEALL